MTPEERAKAIVPGPVIHSDDMTAACIRKEIARAIRQAVADEREACASLADEGMTTDGKSLSGRFIALDIRNRGQ